MGWSGDVLGATLQYMLEEEKFGLRHKVLCLPGEWFNGTGAVFKQPWGPTPVMQLLEAHKLLESKEGEGEPYPGTTEVKAFWSTVTETKRVLNEAKDRGHTEISGAFQEEVRDLKDAVEIRAWDVDDVRVGVARLKAKLKIGEVVGFEAVHG